jgi:hypothetical protein
MSHVIDYYATLKQISIRSMWSHKGKGKSKTHPRTGHEGPEGKQKYNFTLSLTSVLDGVGGQHHVPVALPPLNTRYPLYMRLGRAQGWFGRVRKISYPTGI